MRKLKIILFSIFFLLLFNNLLWSATPANMEKGDVVYCNLPLAISYHAGIFLDYEGSSADNLNNYHVAEQTQSGYQKTRTLYGFMHDFWGYVGAKTKNPSVSTRTGIVEMAKNDGSVRFPYVQNLLTSMIDLQGGDTDTISNLSNIAGIRCDGWVELIYALNGVTIQQTGSGKNILTNTSWYNEGFGLTYRTPVTQFNAMSSASGAVPTITVKNSNGDVIPEGGVTGKNVTVEVNDGGNGSGLCHFQVFQGSDASGTPLNQFWNSAYYNESSHTYTLNDLPEGQICVLAHDQAGNFSQHGFMLA